MASITKRGNSYRITVSNGQRPDGRQIVETTTWRPDPERTEKQNEKALRAFALHFEEQVKAGKYLSGEKITFQDFTKLWLSDYAQVQLSPKSIETYKIILHTHIYPAIGNLKLSRIQPLHLTQLYRKLSNERTDGRPGGYSDNTIKLVHKLISSIFNQAVRWNVIELSPAGRVSPPKSAESADRVKHFTPQQARLFLELLEDQETKIKLFLALALFTGCRRGELVALEWSDVNIHDRIIDITKATGRINGALVTKAPKTKSSIRKVSFPGSVAGLLSQWRKEQLSYRLSIGDKWTGGNYIFTAWDGRQMDPTLPYRKLKRIIAGYNETAKPGQELPDIPLHGLRHTCATLLISENMNNKAVSAILGHTNISTTMDIYAHALQEAQEEAADKLENLLQKKA